MKKNIIKSILKVAGLGVAIFVVYLISQAGKCSSEPQVLTEDVDAVSTSDEVVNEGTEIATKGSIFVYVCGAVNRPGVYELIDGSRVYEAVNLAGGLRDDACITAVNLADFLEDARKIYIPITGEADSEYLEQSGSDAEAFDKSSGQGLVNINTASSSELQSLNGIGPKLAATIVEYRNSNGAFATKEDIKKVSGIGNGIYAKLENEITVQ